MVLDLMDCQEKLAARLQEITEWQERDKGIAQDFEAFVGGDKHPEYAALLKIFKKKVKRAKKKNNDNGSDDGSEGSDDYESEESDYYEDSGIAFILQCLREIGHTGFAES